MSHFRGNGMPLTATDTRPPRSSAFGTRTGFKWPGASVCTALEFAFLRTFKPEHDARAIGSLHFAYWVILSRARLAKLLRASGQAGRARAQLLFFSDFSGEWEVYLAGFNAKLLMVLDLVWGTATDWKPRMNLDAYLRYIREHESLPPVYVQSYGDTATVWDVRCALRLSERLDQFASRASASAADFEAAYTDLLSDMGTQL
jgi:hypothetical protein